MQESKQLTPELFMKMPRRVRRLAFTRFKRKRGILHYRHSSVLEKSLLVENLWDQFFMQLSQATEQK